MRIRFIIFLFVSLFSIQSFGQTVDFEFSEVCIGNTTILTSTSVSPNDPILSWGWDLGLTDNVNDKFDDAAGEVVSYTFPQAKLYWIGLKITTKSGFEDAFYQEVQVGNFPVANFTSENSCANDFTKFINQSTIVDEDLEDFLWDFGDGGTNNYEKNPSHWYANSATYNVRLTAISNLGCSHETVKQIHIQTVPDFNFTFSGATTFNEGESLIVTAVGDFDEILWSTGSTNTSITITNGGYYFANIKKGGCPNLKSFTTIVIDRVGVANLITPNGDNKNDQWKIYNIENHSPCQVSVFSREGTLVYSSTNYDNQWDGTYNGNPLPEGVYYYVINCNEGLFKKGALSIIR